MPPSPRVPCRPGWRKRLLLALTLAHLVAAAGCDRPGADGVEADTRPSILLFVSDTTRFDAVSAYGRAKGTTPTMDRLARDGVLYETAYAQAPWTLPSHVTMFTGLLPSQHRVGFRETYAPDALVMLAELLAAAGYQTRGVSENAWVSGAFNVVQGFETFVSPDQSHTDVVAEVQRLSRSLDPRRPFFFFVNVVDPHAPYRIHPHCPDLPRGLTPHRARRLPQDPGYYLCIADRMPRRLEWLHALYRCDVGAADQKLAAILAALGPAAKASGRPMISVVTADHGEHFGEHRLVSHQFSLKDELLHVPLIVHGLAGVAPGVVEQPVQLADLTPSILRWAGLEPPETMIGRPLPMPGSPPVERTIVSEYADYESLSSDTRLGTLLLGLARGMRRHCGEHDRVFGDMRSVIRYPLKLILYDRYPAELFDLARDPQETTNLAEERPSQVQTLREGLAALETRKSGGPSQGGPAPRVDDDVLRRLEALGYVKGTHPATPDATSRE